MGELRKTDIKELKKLMIDNDLEKIIDLSEATGIDRNTLGYVLSGEKQPSADVMEKLVIGLKIPPETAGRIFFNTNLHNT